MGYVWCEIRQQSSEEPCDETSFGKNIDLDWRSLSVVIKVRFKNLISLRHAKNRILSLE